MVPYMLSQFCCLMRLACDQIQSGLLKVLKFVFGHMPKNRNEAGFLAPFWFVTVVKKEKMKADQKINMGSLLDEVISASWNPDSLRAKRHGLGDW